MAFQPSVAEYFNNRKRAAVDDLKKVANTNKVLVLDGSSPSIEFSKPQNVELKEALFAKKRIVYAGLNKEQVAVLGNRKQKPKAGQNGVGKNKKVVKPDGSQRDIRTTLLNAANKKKDTTNNGSANSQTEVKPTLSADNCNVSVSCEPNVPFHIKGPLSPVKSKVPTGLAATKDSEKIITNPENSSKADEASTSSCRRELNLGNIKAMMSRSSRLEEIKAGLKRFNENRAKLSDIQAKDIERQSPQSSRVELNVTPNFLKTPTKVGHFTSPQGKLTPSRLFASPPSPVAPSPLKSPLKSPAFQRYQALVTEGRPALVLPFKYRALAEVFRCVDMVASMLHNRKETITLSKLRPAVQEISRKNLTEYHLGQIKTVFPHAFDYSIEKMREFGSTEKYELVMKPSLLDVEKKENEGEEHVMMNPSVLLARRRVLYNALLELTKDHHEEFLKTLEPPMCIPRSRLTRWHPEFAVDDVPDIVSAALPQPPNVEKVTTAKDVLERARDLFVVNPRMERALRRVSADYSITPEAPPAPVAVPTLTKPALHGVPASLLEKVRAKQAARALEAMTRTPAQAKEAVRLTRLPEIARIVRNLFVAEKKSVLPREMVLKKMADSYRESLSHSELDDHLKLLAGKTPGWMTFCNLRKTDYVKLSRDADMNRIMFRLERIAADKCV